MLGFLIEGCRGGVRLGLGILELGFKYFIFVRSFRFFFFRKISFFGFSGSCGRKYGC